MIRNLSFGSKGPDVKAVQEALNYRRRREDPCIKPDGDFGKHTRAAVLAFQERFDLVTDGIVGYHTRKALFPLVGFTTYLGVSRSRGAYGDFPDPAGTRGIALASTAGGLKAKGLSAGGLKGAGFTGGGLKAKGDAGGDVPDPDPSPLLPLLPPLTDPFSAPMKPLNLTGFSIPVPSMPETLFGLPQDQAQVQAGGQFTARHFWVNKPGSPNPSLAAVLAIQQVYARNKDQPGHLEVALGVQALGTFLAQTSDGVGLAVQPYIQFTWADPFWRRGMFHLVAPFAQISAQTDPKLSDATFGVGLFPVNISMDLSDRLSIIGQAGVVGGWDLAAKRGEIGPQAGLFGSWSF
jgi:peptidoglycan hydrolase-like protein with peptidoglycan-binding domain